jgi:hypothetical protein
MIPAISGLAKAITTGAVLAVLAAAVYGASLLSVALAGYEPCDFRRGDPEGSSLRVRTEWWPPAKTCVYREPTGRISGVREFGGWLWVEWAIPALLGLAASIVLIGSAMSIQRGMAKPRRRDSAQSIAAPWPDR